jgi:hypothetical protein
MWGSIFVQATRLLRFARPIVSATAIRPPFKILTNRALRQLFQSASEQTSRGELTLFPGDTLISELWTNPHGCQHNCSDTR